MGQAVVDCWPICIHKCHQGFELGVRTKEDKKDFVNETFSEVDLVREY